MSSGLRLYIPNGISLYKTVINKVEVQKGLALILKGFFYSGINYIMTRLVTQHRYSID